MSEARDFRLSPAKTVETVPASAMPKINKRRIRGSRPIPFGGVLGLGTMIEENAEGESPSFENSVRNVSICLTEEPLYSDYSSRVFHERVAGN
jgi:hypothetical protein